MGGGGDGGFSERQDRTDASKARARSALNVLFGVAPTVAVADMPDRASFTTNTTTGSGQDQQVGPTVFDQAGYDAAVAAAQHANDAAASDATTNKAGLDALFQTTRDNAYTAGKRRVDEQKTTAGRDLKFELFARGLNGGSTDIDQNALLGRTYTQGLTDLGAKADGTATQLRGDNEAARLQLLQSIDSGMDQGSAISSALGQMKVNADRAASDATGTAIGDLFANTGLIYQQNRVAQGKQNAANAWATTAASAARPATSGARSGALTFAG